MSLLDAQGRPTAQPSIPADQLVRILGSHRQKIDALNVQIIQMGLFVEYLYDQQVVNLARLAEEAAARGVEISLGIDMQSFPAWAERRYIEVQQEAAAALAAQEGAPAAEAGVDLSESR